MKTGFSFLLLATGAFAAPFGLESRPPLDGLTFPANVPLSAQYEIVNAFPNLEFEKALFVTSPPGDASRLYVLEQGGRILTFPNTPAASTTAEFLDVGPLLSSDAGEEELLGLAFDPDYANNGYFYLNYTAPGPRRTVVARYRRLTPDKADPSSARILLEVRQPFSNHNGGMMAFGPDGYLYIGPGDGGSAGDPENHGQNRSSLLGKILRIDPHGGDPYGIPDDNPFKGQAGTRPEIYALGLRNPWRFSFDRLTHELWVGDVGQNRFEEIDLIARGDNLGWNECEGRHRYGAAGACPSRYKAPLHEYPRSLGGSVTGGYVFNAGATYRF